MHILYLYYFFCSITNVIITGKCLKTDLMLPSIVSVHISSTWCTFFRFPALFFRGVLSLEFYIYEYEYIHKTELKSVFLISTYLSGYTKLGNCTNDIRMSDFGRNSWHINFKINAIKILSSCKGTVSLTETTALLKKKQW